MDDARSLLRLLQLTDSGFPTGAFAFSHGLEGLLAAGVVTAEPHVAEVMTAHLREGFAGIECPAMAHAWRAARAADVDSLTKLDGLLDALKPVSAFRNSSARTGRRLLESASGVVSGPMIVVVRQSVRDGAMVGHHALAFGVVMEAAGVAEATAGVALGAGFVNSLAAAAVRLGIVGAGAAQRLVAGFADEIRAAVARGRHLELDEMGAFLPTIDVAGLRQPTLAGRVFAS
jgi:urease accessory protein